MKSSWTILNNNKLLVLKIYTIMVIFVFFFTVLPAQLICNFGLQNPADASRAFSFDFEYRNNYIVIDPKGEGAAVIDITNTGDDDTYSLTLESPPSGWKAYFENGKHTFEKRISSSNNYPVRIFLSAPSSGSMLLKATCRSKGSSLTLSDQATIEAKYIIRTTIEDSNKVHAVKAGEKTEFTLNVTNYQDDSDEVYLALEDTFINLQNYADELSWSAWFDNRSFTLSPGESKLIGLAVFAPKDGSPGDRVNLVVVASVQSTSQTFISKEFFAEIPKIYDIDYEIKQRTQSELVFPNSTVNYTLKLFNTGNIDTSITLRVFDNPENWGVAFYRDKNRTNPQNLKMKVGAVLEFLVQLKVPLNAKNQTHNITYGIHTKESFEIPLKKFNISTNVRLKSKISLSLSQHTVNVNLDSTTYTNIIVHNEGNGLDVINISILVPSIPTGWLLQFDRVKNVDAETDANSTTQVDFLKPIKLTYLEPTEFVPLANSNYGSISLKLDANKKAFMRLAITAPNTGKAGTETVKIYGESDSGTFPTMVVDLDLKLIVSNLVVSKINVTPVNPIPGDKVSVEVTITNEFHLPANDFRVAVTKITDAGPLELGSEQVATLGPNEAETVEFTWTEPDAGLASYIVKVEITGSIISDDNVPRRTKNVLLGEPSEDSDTSDDLGGLVVGLIAAIIIAIIIFLILWLILSRRVQEGETTTESETDAKQNTMDKKASLKKSTGKRGKYNHDRTDPRISPKNSVADKLKSKKDSGPRNRSGRPGKRSK